MALYTTLEAPVSVLSLSTLKQFIRLDPTDTSEDDILNLIMSGVISEFERCTSVVLGDTKFQLDTFIQALQVIIPIDKNPVTSITSVQILTDTYKDIDYTAKLFYNSHIHIEGNPTSNNNYNTFRATFNAGLGEIPEGLKLALYQHCAFAYSNRGDCSIECDGLPATILNTYNQFKVLSL
jgi:uncharacterized phiE125 gp8 family phage protein